MQGGMCEPYDSQPLMPPGAMGGGGGGMPMAPPTDQAQMASGLQLGPDQLAMLAQFLMQLTGGSPGGMVDPMAGAMAGPAEPMMGGGGMPPVAGGADPAALAMMLRGGGQGAMQPMMT